jgi:hypothetical protein
MTDVLVILVATALFALAAGYVRACERLLSDRHEGDRR